MKTALKFLLVFCVAAAATTGLLWLGNSLKKPLDRKEIIKQWLSKNEPEPTTYCPNINDRGFWKKFEKDVPKIDPPEGPLPTDLNVVIASGTQQELVYDTGAWIPVIEDAITQQLTKPWSEPIQGFEFTDLHASQTAGNLARTLAALKPRLNPGLVTEATQTIRKKVTGPFLKDAEKYQKQSLAWTKDMCAWLEGPSNWTAVCIHNILYAILALEPDINVRAQAIALAETPLEEYLGTAEEDGYLASGIRYWNYGFGNLMCLNERLAKTTGGKLTLTENPKIQKMAEFKKNSQIWKEGRNEYYPLFADNNNPTPTREWLDKLCHFRFGLAAPETCPLTPSTGPIDDLMAWLTQTPRTGGGGDKKAPAEDLTSVYYTSSGTLISRHEDGVTVLAVKGGNNDEEHNHNDIGSYTLFDSGKVVTGDLGTVTYTRPAFSAARYEIDIFSSFGHPLPVLDNHLQIPGALSKANVINHEISPEKDTVTYDLTAAYGTPGLKTLTRTITFTKTGKPKVTVTDSFEAGRPISFETALISPKGKMKGNEIDLGEYTAKFESNTPIETKDSRFWKDEIPERRFAAQIQNKETKGEITCTIEKRP